MIILGTNSIKDTGFNVANSLRFNSGSSDYLSKAFSSHGTRTKWTWSIWFKRSILSGSNVLGACYFNDSNEDRLEIDSNGQMIWYSYQSNAYVGRLKTNRKFRDVSAWYHLVLRWDTGDSTADNRMKIWINGVEETSFANRDNPSSDAESLFNYGDSSQQWVIGQTANVNHWNGYMAEVVFCDNQKLEPTSFGEYNSDSPTIWQPIDVSGLTFGTNGFYLDFEDSSALGNDAAGSNNFTVNNLTAIDQSTDTCTNNFATLNPLSVNTDQGTFSEGNLQLLHGSSAFRTGFASIGASQGKWYCEIKRVTATSFAVGVISLDFKSITPNITYMGGVGTPNLGYLRDGNTSVNGSETSGYESYANGDTLMIAMDLDNGKVYFAKNGNWGNSGDPTSGATGTGARSITVGGETWSFGVSVFNATAQCNFGSPMYAISSGNADDNGYGNFEYDVPAGYYSLNTKNLAEFG